MTTTKSITTLLDRLDRSTCNFLAVKVIEDALRQKGFVALNPAESWHLVPGCRYYLTKNGSAIFAVVIGDCRPSDAGYNIIAAHSDSPCFKIKPGAEIYNEGGLITLNVEKYGGGILYTWFDRPLSISGRFYVKGADPMHPERHLVDFRRPMCTIPHLAIHFNRGVNEGNRLSVQSDMKPVMGQFSATEIENFKLNGGLIKNLLARESGVDINDILDYELCLYPWQPATVTGLNHEFFQSARIDDLSMAFAGLEALEKSLDSVYDGECSGATRVLAVFDNEETGSGTKQGAASPVLRNLLARITMNFDDSSDAEQRALARSFMISADDAHAWHPNYNSKYDPTNHPQINRGPVVKINANCKYMTDAHSASVFRSLCEAAGVNCQYFVNHSDVAGGSTLGNISSSHLDIPGVDMGNAIWAMHSACETAGVHDHIETVKVFRLFYEICGNAKK